MSGFGASVTTFSSVMIIKNIIALCNPEKLKARQIEETDERNVHIYEKSMAITFRISTILQAILAIVLVILDNEWGAYLGLMAGGEFFIFIICNVILCKRS